MNQSLSIRSVESADVGPDGTDKALVVQCLGRDARAWDELYDRYHHRLLQAIRAFVGSSADQNLVEEIAARVWYTVSKRDFQVLARFVASPGLAIVPFLAGIARNEYSAFLRTEQRRRTREHEAGVASLRGRVELVIRSKADFEEFLATLSPREREYCLNQLRTEQQSEGVDRISDANSRQLRHRIRRKLAGFLGRA